ncbi:PAS domain S-box protein [Dongia soli]|uniref:PAS domain S-box protein n=1 Tax=Dongia soli TaxID=600628 RepID=A0ABU5EFU4_9PROT|nr:PAS domain S-box protein [Dongia soli]MDY0884390.1 PAS domain S-box protein [Dongia soli]
MSGGVFQKVNSMVELAIYMLDAAGQVLSCTAGAQDLQGHAPAEIVGRSFDRLFGEEDRAAQVPAAILAAAGEVGQSRQSGWLVRKDGSQFLASLDVHVLRDTHGAVLGFAVAVQASTEKLNAKSGAVAPKPLDFQLVKESAVTPSIYGLAHDINNMLAVISASVELISRYPEDVDRVQRMATNIKQAVARAECLTKLCSPPPAEEREEANTVTHADPLGDLAAGLVPVMQAGKGREKKRATLNK